MSASSGMSAAHATLEQVLAGELADADVRISAETLRHQAAAAACGGNPQLRDNLLRAAELTRLGDAEVLALYEQLRPGRASAEQLDALRAELFAAELPLCAALVAEALSAYRQRGLVR